MSACTKGIWCYSVPLPCKVGVYHAHGHHRIFSRSEFRRRWGLGLKPRVCSSEVQDWLWWGTGFVVVKKFNMTICSLRMARQDLRSSSTRRDWAPLTRRDSLVKVYDGAKVMHIIIMRDWASILTHQTHHITPHYVTSSHRSTSHYDDKIFSLATLLSSKLYINNRPVTNTESKGWCGAGYFFAETESRNVLCI